MCIYAPFSRLFDLQEKEKEMITLTFELKDLITGQSDDAYLFLKSLLDVIQDVAIDKVEQLLL